MSQLELVLRPPDIAKAERQREEKVRKRLAKKSIDQQFAEFASANPHVFDELRRLAMAKLDAGATRIGMKALWEELRAALIRISDGGDGGLEYKLNNNYTALYARMLVRADRRLDGVIEMRKRKGE